MTAISNVLCSDFIACGSDSFLTKQIPDSIEYVETERLKIFALDGLAGAMSYWGALKLYLKECCRRARGPIDVLRLTVEFVHCE